MPQDQYYYQILPSRKIPQFYLTYKSEVKLDIGQVVEINIRGGLSEAIVTREIAEAEINFDISKIKAVNNIYNYRLPKEVLVFLKIFNQNSFNSINLSLSSFLQPLKLVTQKQWKSLPGLNIQSHFPEVQHTPTLKPEFILDISITLRIIYIIRSAIDTKTLGSLLIIFPEKKYLIKVLEELQTNPEFKTVKDKLEIYTYSGDVNKKSKDAIWDLISPSNLGRLKIYFTTRAGIFLPFKNLNKVILIDEANSMHIQDQNSIYFDTRDAVFLLSQAYQCSLVFLSTLPSLRLYNFYPENILEQVNL